VLDAPTELPRNVGVFADDNNTLVALMGSGAEHGAAPEAAGGKIASVLTEISCIFFPSLIDIKIVEKSGPIISQSSRLLKEILLLVTGIPSSASSPTSYDVKTERFQRYLAYG